MPKRAMTRAFFYPTPLYLTPAYQQRNKMLHVHKPIRVCSLNCVIIIRKWYLSSRPNVEAPSLYVHGTLVHSRSQRV